MKQKFARIPRLSLDVVMTYALLGRNPSEALQYRWKKF